MRTRTLLTVAIGASLVAGCSNGSPSRGVAHIGSAKPTATSTHASSPLAFSRCMRAHGVPNFPDPDTSGNIKVTNNSGIDLNSPQLQAAQQACKGYAPTPPPGSAAKLQDQMLKWAKCLRAHGIPNFPDPVVDNGRVQIKPPAGVNPDSPQFKAAQDACKSLSPGTP